MVMQNCDNDGCWSYRGVGERRGRGRERKGGGRVRGDDS